MQWTPQISSRKLPASESEASDSTPRFTFLLSFLLSLVAFIFPLAAMSSDWWGGQDLNSTGVLFSPPDTQWGVVILTGVDVGPDDVVRGAPLNLESIASLGNRVPTWRKSDGPTVYLKSWKIRNSMIFQILSGFRLQKP